MQQTGIDFISIKGVRSRHTTAEKGTSGAIVLTLGEMILLFHCMKWLVLI